MNKHGEINWSKLRRYLPLLTTIGVLFLSPLHANEIPVADPQAVSTFEDVPLAITLTGSDLDGDSITFSIVTGPSHGFLDGIAPNLTYTPQDDFSGTDSFSFKVNDGVADSPPASIEITIDAVNDPPSFIVGSNQQELEDSAPVNVPAWATAISAGAPDETGQVLSFLITANDNPGLFSSGPAISPTGTLSYSLAADSNGIANITVVLMDDGGTANGGDADSQEHFFSISVTPVNDPPSFSTGVNPVVDEDETSTAITGWASNIASGPPDESGQIVSFLVTGNSNPSLFSSGPAISTAGNLTYSLVTNANGTADLLVKAVDNGGTDNQGIDSSDNQPFSITVVPVNDRPIAANQTLEIDEDIPSPITLTANDPEDDPLTFAVVAPPLQGSLSGSPPDLIYTPPENFSGFDSFSFKANDGALDSTTKFVDIEIVAVNDPPVADAKSTTIAEDEPVDIILSGSDIEGDSLTFQVTTPPLHGSVSINGTVASYSPDPFYFGSDSFNYVANDGEDLSSPATVSITITPVNDSPFVGDDNLTLERGATTSVLNGGFTSLLANDLDIEGDAMVVTTTPVTPPAHGSVTLFSDGTFSYTHDNSLNLGDYFEYQVCDDQVPAACSVGAVNVFINLGPNGVCSMPEAAIPDNDPVNGVSSTIDFEPTGPIANVGVKVLIDHTWVGDLTVTLSHDGNTVRLMERPGKPAVQAGCNGQNVDAIFDDEASITANDQCLSSTETPVISGTILPIDLLGTFQGGESVGEWTLKVTDSNSLDVGTLISWCLIAVVNPPGNTIPVADAQSVSVNEDSTLGITLTGSDPESDPLTFKVRSGPSNGSLSGSAPNLTYSPNPDFNGSDSFTFTVNDGYLTSSEAVISIMVNNVNDAPQAHPDRINTLKGASVSTVEGGGLSLLENDSDPEGDSLSVTTTPISGPAHGSLTLNGNGTFFYTHDDSFSPTDKFVYEVCDNGTPSQCSTAAVEIWIDLSASPQCSAPSAPIPDTDVIFGISDLISLSGPGGIGDINVLVDIQHTQVADLLIELNSHDGKSVTLLDRPGTSNPDLVTGCTGDNIDALFDDDAGTNAESQCNEPPPAIAGSVRPFGSLGTFVGSGIDGSWTMRVYDTQSSNTGVLRQWCLFTSAAANTAPFAYPQTVDAVEETAVGITLTGFDVDGDSITYAIAGQPSNGSLGGTAPDLTYTPAADFFGTDSFTFRTNDGTTNSSLATVTINVSNVNDPPVANSQSVSTNEDIVKSITLTGSDIDEDSLTFELLTPPSHGTLIGLPPNLSYRPTQNYNGSDSFTFRVNDGSVNSAPATVSLTIIPVDDAPTALPSAEVTEEDTPVEVSMFGVEVDFEPLTFSIVSPPSHGVIEGTGSIRTYTPATDFFGDDSFTFKVNDGNQDSDPATVSITVTPVNDPPSAASDAISAQRGQSATVLDGGSSSLVTNDLDPEGDTLSVSSIPLTPPTYGTVILGSDGTFNYLHDNSISTSDSFEYEVCDDGDPAECDSAWVTVHIDLSNSPECSAPLAFIPDNDPLTGTSDTLVLANSGTIADMNVFLRVSHDYVGQVSATLSRGDSQIILLDRPGFTGTGSGCNGIDIEAQFDDEAASAAEDACSGTAPALAGELQPLEALGSLDGQDIAGSWVLTVTDAEAGATGIFEQWCILSQSSSNSAPVASPQSKTTDEDAPILITMTASDDDGDSLTFSIAAAPTHGVLSGVAPNVIYTPDPDYFGPDSFNFTANDGAVDSTPATVSITVNPVNDAPVANNQSVSTSEDVPTTITLTASDTEGAALSFTVLSSTANGALTGSAPDLTYTPGLNFSGTDSFTFKVNDGTLDSNTATVDIMISSSQDPPVANAQSVDTNEDTPRTITLSGSDPDGDPLSYQVVQNPLHGNLGGTPPELIYTPDPNYFGSDNFTFKVNDGFADSATASVSITVNPVNDPPVATGEAITALKGLETTTLDGGGSSLLTNDNDLEGDTLTVTITPVLAPLHGTLILNGNGTFSYTHDNSRNANDSFVYEICDDGAPIECDTASVSIYVDLSVDDNCNAPLLDIPDNDAATGVSDTIVFDGSGGLEDMDIYILISHDLVGDLSATLTHDGKDVSLLERPGVPGISSIGCDFADIEAEFDDSAAISAEDSCETTPPAISGFVIPASALAAYNGDNVNGSWTLTVTDARTANTGILEQWCLVPTVAGNTAPVANPDSVSTNEDIAKSITLTATDLDGDGLTYSIVAQPVNGILSGAAPNVVYTPDLNYSGADSFTFKANDGSLDSNIATVSITVNPVEDNPVADAQSVSIDEDSALPITLTGSDPEGSPLTFIKLSDPVNGSLSGTLPDLIYTPNAQFFGADSFTFKVNDGALDSAPAIISIIVNSVNDVPVATSQSLVTAEDVALPIVLSGSDIDGDTLTFEVVSPPSNGILSGTAPNLSYAPAANYFGPDSFTFRVNDGSANSAAATVSITINAINDQPVADSQSLSTNEDNALPITLTGSDDDGDSLTYSVLNGPFGGTLTGSAPTLTYTPNENFFGGDNFTFLVNDGVEDSSIATVSITVVPVNDPPVAIGQSVATDEDQALPITLTGSDDDNDALDYVVVSFPAEGFLSGTPPNLTYTPRANYFGADSFAFRVNDGTADSANATVNITVNSINDKPVAISQVLVTDEDVALPVTLTGSDADGDELTYTVVVQPTSGVLSGIAPNLTYTPDAFYNGADSFTFKVNDGVIDSSDATIQITVNSVNNQPTAFSQSVSTDEDTALPITLTANDDDGDDLTFSLIDAPGNGNLGGIAPDLVYTPDSNYFGADSFTFRVNDGLVDSLPATVSITVNAVNDPPVADSQSVTTDEDTTLPIVLTGSDDDGDSLTFVIVVAPSSGSLEGTPPNVSYLPNAHFNGSDSFTFKTNDGSADSGVATVSITVNSINDVPTANGQTVSTAEDAPLPITLTGDDNDGDSLSFEVLTQPLNGELTGMAPNLVYTPDENYNGPDSFTFRVNDGQVNSPPAAVDITVTALNDAPVATGESITALKGMQTAVLDGGGDSLLTNDTDPDGDNLTVSPTPIVPPEHGTVTLFTDGTFSYLHDNTLNAADSFIYEICDDGTPSQCDTALVSIYVDLSVDSLCRAPVLDIPDNDSATGVSDVLSLTNQGAIEDINVYLLASHTSVGDLSASLSHDGVIVDLLDRPGTTAPGAAGCQSDDIEVQFDDEAGETAEDTCNESAPAISGLLIPTGSLANFDGENVTGDWTLKVTDARSGETGVFEQWCLVLSVAGNTAPVADDQAITTDEDTSKNITLTASDIDGDDISFTIASQPANGTVSGTAPDVVYTPNENYFGTDSFTFTATDGSLESAPAMIDITINAVNDPPVAVSQSVATDEDQALPITLSGDDPDSDTLDYVITVSPSNGSLSGAPPNLTYTPQANFNGVDSFSFKVNDGTVDSAIATVNITINSINDQPIAESQSLSTNEDNPLPITLAGSDSDGDSLTYSISGGPVNGVLTGSAPNLTYTPNENFSGADAFTFVVNDGAVDSSIATIDITVVPINDPPVANIDNMSLSKGETATTLSSGEDSVLANDTDVEGNNLLVSVPQQSGPNHGSLILNTNGTFSYTHDDSSNGIDQFVYEVCDDGVPAECDTGIVSIAIDVGERPEVIEKDGFEDLP